jgi:hypothetical protein
MEKLNVNDHFGRLLPPVKNFNINHYFFRWLSFSSALDWPLPPAPSAENFCIKNGPQETRAGIFKPIWSHELVFLNVYGALESIPRNEFRQPM